MCDNILYIGPIVVPGVDVAKLYSNTGANSVLGVDAAKLCSKWGLV